MESSILQTTESTLADVGLRVAIIGPGALGTLFAVRLATAGTSTILLDYRAERAASLNEGELSVVEASAVRTARVPVVADPNCLADIDLALVLVKAYKTEQVGATLTEFLPSTAAVLTLQNGLGNVETLQLHLGAGRVFGGTVAQGALQLSPGVVRDTGGGPIIVGQLDGQSDERLDAICQVLLRAGFAVSITDNLAGAIWQKTILNAAINPVGALTRLRNGQLVERESSLKLVTATAREAFQVARAHGIQLEEHDWGARLQTICQATAPNLNSMLQDILAQRRTEIDAINGAITRIGEAHHLLTPVNRTLWYLVSAIERQGDDSTELSQI